MCHRLRLVLWPVMRSVGEFGKHNRTNSNFAQLVESYFSLRCLSSKTPAEERVYTSEQRDVVIDRLNSIRTDDNARKLLGAKLATNIETHLQKNGNFTRLEELLQVQAIGPKTIRNVCDKLLGIGLSKPSNSVAKPAVRRLRSSANMVSPQLPEETRATVQILVAIIVDIASISWATVDTKRKYLLDWQVVEIGPDEVSLKDIITKAAGLQKLFPDANLYILEDPTPGSINSRGGQHMRSHLTCSLATSIHNHREENGEFKLAFVKNRLVEKHFKATVGSETVSLQPFMYDVIDQKTVLGRSNLFVPQELVGYMKSHEPLLREQLCRAGLLALSCIDLVLSKTEANEVPDRST